jgi:hypothetical protein
MDIDQVTVGHPDTSGKSTQDVVDLLLEQHEQVKMLMARVADGAPGDRAASFEALADLLERHETAEQEIVHAATKDAAHAPGVADQRVAEEEKADSAMATLKECGVDHPDFGDRFSEFRSAVLDHAEHEENEEFPRLRATLDGETLMRMARDVREIEGIQPNR